MARTPPDPAARLEPPLPSLVLRSAFGGALMGLANLVPGISGGTMLLAAGVYPEFIESIARVTRLRLRLRPLLVLGIIGAAAVLAILLLAGTLRDLVLHQRWVMFSLFIGLTLGGVPLVWRLARPLGLSGWVGVGAGFTGMAALAAAQASTAVDGAGGGNGPLLLFLAGVAGAAAMILPGLSGGYLLLLLGQYLPILDAVDRFKSALQAVDLAAAAAVAASHLLPVGLGVLAGVLVVSNVVRFLLVRFPRPSLGVLLGLLLGAVLGLWPFERTLVPDVGADGAPGAEIAVLEEVDLEDLATEPYRPAPLEALAAVALGLAGYGVTRLVARLGAGEERTAQLEEPPSPSNEAT